MIRAASPIEWGRSLAHVLRCDVALPSNVAAEGSTVAGFADEAAVRQDAQGVSVFAEAARAQSASGFFVVWAGLQEDLSWGDGAFVELHALPDCIDLVDLANLLDPELCFRDRWVAFSSHGSWAVYGETYGAELAVFVSRDRGSEDVFKQKFNSLLSASEVIEQLVPTDTVQAVQFASLFAKEYCQNGVRFTS